MTYIERILDVETGEVIEQELTAKEIADVEANIAKTKADAKAYAEREAAKEALYTKLGLTADEVKLLLG
jgi:phosphopantetheinyl transferase (holo-ACP synthase)